MKITIGSKGRHYAAKFSILLIMVALITGMPASYGVGGDDNHPSQNLEIRTWYDLHDVRDNLNGDHILMNALNSTTPGYTSLASPTANGGKGWEPIGYSTPGPAGCQASSPILHGFSGTLDGQGYEICDLFINRPVEYATGLLAYLNEGGIIKNVGVVNFTVIGYNVVGSLVGYNNGGTISNCYSTGNVTGHGALGGLVGCLYDGNISNSYSTGNVSAESCIGGLVGQQHSEGTISNSYSTCSVVAVDLHIGSRHIGGLVGDNYYGDVNVISSFWDTETSGRSISDGGTGKNTTEMHDIATFLAAGWNITAVALNETNPVYIWNIVNNVTYPFLAVMVGCGPPSQNLEIRDWYDLDAIRDNLCDHHILMNDLDSTTAGYTELASPTANQGKGWQPIGTEDSPFTGTFDGQGHEIRDLFINRPDERNNGLFGKTSEGGIENVGVVNVTVIGDEHVGGLVAWNDESTVSNSYCTGNVSGDDDVGGLVGWNPGGTVTNSYSTCNVTGNNDVGGLVGDESGTVTNSFWDTETSGQSTSGGGTGKTTAEMQDIATFSGAGWDIIAVANPGLTNTTYIWNIVNNVTYPFLSWEPVS